MKLEKIVASTRDCVVAIEPENDKSVLYLAKGEERIREEIPFKPFILLENAKLLESLNPECEIVELNGSAHYRVAAIFDSATKHEEALKFLKQTTGQTWNAPNAQYRNPGDATQQALINSQIRLFRGMQLEQLRRMQFDIETIVEPGFEFSNPDRAEDQIVIITMAFSNGETKTLSQEDMSEKELLIAFVDAVRKYDPDVLEGHNIFRFDLPFIETRAKRHKVPLLLGRDNSRIKKRNSRFSAAERTINYPRYDIYGRHVVDTMHLTIFYDISHRNLDSYGLKYVAKHFGVAAPERTYIDSHNICNAWSEDRNSLLKYAVDDVIETRALSEIMLPSYFYMTQLIPMKFQDCVVRGNATCIEAMLIAEYFNARQSVPRNETSRSFTGGLTKAFLEGVFENVWHCDVRSLYPSIILANKLTPTRDELKAFPRLLGELRNFRLAAKDAERRATTTSERNNMNALQTTFKILINSFYGYLGFSQGSFNDFAMAETVTSTGREILTKMMNFLNKSGAKVIEMDTDGIYFQPPAGVTNTAKFEELIQSELPNGIEVELDETYPAMFCYKSKNYALLTASGEVTLVGAALKSRGLEPFQREFIRELISMLLHRREEEIDKMIKDSRKAIENREWSLDKFAKTETLRDSLEVYKRKQATGGRRSAAYELAEASKRDYRAGDQVSFYVFGDKKKVSVVGNSCLLSETPPERNENIPYYLDKLESLIDKFLKFIPVTPEDDLFS